MNLIFLSLIKTQQIYVILGGSGAANFNNYTYDLTNHNVYSYDNGWVTAQSPMPGGDGEEGSPWASLGNNLNLRYGEDIYFIDCAKINASIIDWNKDGKYYQYSPHLRIRNSIQASIANIITAIRLKQQNDLNKVSKYIFFLCR